MLFWLWIFGPHDILSVLSDTSFILIYTIFMCWLHLLCLCVVKYLYFNGVTLISGCAHHTLSGKFPVILSILVVYIQYCAWVIVVLVAWNNYIVDLCYYLCWCCMSMIYIHTCLKIVFFLYKWACLVYFLYFCMGWNIALCAEYLIKNQ
jgi:hypothetical protein